MNTIQKGEEKPDAFIDKSSTACFWKESDQFPI